MLGIVDPVSFVLSTLVFLMIPGPGTFTILTSTARGRLAGGFAAVLGVMMGDWILMFLAAVGVAALLQANPVAFQALRYLGAGYLAWIGIQLLARGGAPANATLLPIGHRRFMRQAFLITLINPKAIVFYMAFFPLFIDPATHRGAVTLVAMALAISTITILYCSLLVFAGNAAARKLAHHRSLGRVATRLAGFALVAFGLKMAAN